MASWHDRMRGRFFIDKFGLGTGRIVSRYPGSWKRQVWDEFEKTFSGSPGEKEQARGRIEELIKRFASPMTKRSGAPDDSIHWLVNAEKEHERKPFHAILAHDNPRQNPSVMLENDILDLIPPSDWEVPKDVPVQRQAGDMADCVAPMLRCATRILFVDPNFDPYQEKYRKPLDEFLRRVDRRRDAITIELHTGNHRGRTQPQEVAQFRRQCKEFLPHIIPTGLEVIVHYWKERLGGKELHNRFIFTDIGGVSFLHGLDCDLGGGSDDIISRLDVRSYSREWRDYAERPNSAFEQDGEPFPVEGQATS